MSEITVVLSLDDKCVYYWQEKGIIMVIRSKEMPDVKPSQGMIELSEVFTKSVANFNEVSEIVKCIFNDNSMEDQGLVYSAGIYRELETYTDNDVEDHLVMETDGQDLIDFMDMINMENLGTIGANEYYTSFQKIDLKE